MYVQDSRRWVKHIDFITLDVICLILSFFVAHEIRDNATFGGLDDKYRSFLYLLVLVHASIIFLSENYGGVLKRGYYREFLATLKQTAFMLAASTVILFASKHGQEFSRIIIFLTFIIYLIISYIVRTVWKQFIRSRIKQDKHNRNLIIITESDRIDKVDYNDLIWNIDGRAAGGIIVTDRDLKGTTLQGVDVVANQDDMMEYLIREWVDEIFIDLNPMTDKFGELYNEICETGIVTHIRIGNFEPGISRINAIENLGKFKVLTTSIRVISPAQQLVKRVFDILGSIVGIVFTLLLSIVIIPAIKIADPGPAIYISERIGANGKRFKFYKFRSMYMDADERKKELAEQNTIKDGMMFKIDNDPRIIKGIGNFIRRTSIDEFPQFWNVLKGEMSLVGTRPPTPDEWERYSSHHRSRMSIKPGITGLWQVSGRSDILDFEEVVKLDNQYMNEWDYGLDIKILIKTVTKVFEGSGAK